jgi:CubicO group peptidase (beta-lactamase class C family)
VKGVSVMRLVKRLVLSVSIAVLVPAWALDAAPGEDYAAEIEVFEAFVQEQMKLDRIPGLSVGFSKGGFRWARGFGSADLENGTAATEKSSYRLASNTKSMAAVAILQLAEAGKLDLDAEARQYVPYFPRKRWPVTLRQLLGHVGGMSHYVNPATESRIREHKDTRDSLAIFAGFDLVAEPGTRYLYSSYGYNLLGAVIEGAARQPFGSYLREHVWGPLEMGDTYMDDPDELIPNRVEGYRLVDGELRNSEFVDISSRFAAGGTRSTVVDLLKYAEGLDGTQVLSQESLELMHTSLALANGRFTDYALGWRVRPVNGRFQASHGGSQPETRTSVVRFPKEDLAVAVAYNFEGASSQLYARRLAQLVLGEAWNREAYVGDRQNAALYGALWEIFNDGLGYFDRHGKARANASAELEEAFQYVNTAVSRQALEADFESASKRIADGRHPVAGEAFVKVGSHIAERLLEAKGAEGLGAYHRLGALPFLADFVELSGQEADHAGERAFSAELATLIGLWDRDWGKTSTDFTRGLVVMPSSDIEKNGSELRSLFEGAQCYPDLSQDLAATTRQLYLSGEAKRALPVARLSEELYPESPLAHVMIGNVYVCLGEADHAGRHYRQARKLDGDALAVSPEGLNRYGVELARRGRTTEGLALLEVAAELFPDAGHLHESIADIHLQRATKLFEKALEVDPTLEHARDMLQKLVPR